MPSIRILIIDDHPIFRHGLVRLLNEEAGVKVCAEAHDAKSGLAAIRRHRPTLVIVDIALPGTNGIDLTKKLLEEWPQLPVIVLSMYKDVLYAERALRAGARGYIAKQEAVTNLIAVIREVMAGNLYFHKKARARFGSKTQPAAPETANPLHDLSDRELQVFQLIGDGKSTRQIAQDLGLSVKTIESYRAHIKEKMNLESGYALVQSAIYWNHFSPKG
jgi:DNA-binding NarL/FixJ family response regulator